MERLSLQTGRVFHEWIGVFTWYSDHEADEGRFDKFIETLISSGDSLTPEELRDLIIETRRGDLLESSLDRVAETYMERYREKLSTAKS